MRSYGVLLPSLLLALSACSPDVHTHHLPDTSRSESVIGGEEIHERYTDAAKSVVVVEIVNSHGQAVSFCTGTLIGTNSVLTAGHCFDKAHIPQLAGFNVVFTDKYSFWWNKTERKGLKWFVPDSYNSTKKEYDHDIAVAFFSGSLPQNYQPVAYDNDERTDHSNATVYVYGYGRSQDYTGGRGQSPMDYVGQLHRGIMKTDAHYDRMPDRYWTDRTVPVFICQGDSGGPQFYHENGELKILGVNSAVYGPRLPNGTTSCKGIAQATKVAPFADWIKKTRADFFNQ
nr:S1 family peptidase [uncultured Bdellovibrio sp.]